MIVIMICHDDNDDSMCSHYTGTIILVEKRYWAPGQMHFNANSFAQHLTEERLASTRSPVSTNYHLQRQIGTGCGRSETIATEAPKPVYFLAIRPLTPGYLLNTEAARRRREVRQGIGLGQLNKTFSLYPKL